MREIIDNIKEMVRKHGPIDFTTGKYFRINPFDETDLYRVSPENTEKFIHELRESGLNVTVRGDHFTASF